MTAPGMPNCEVVRIDSFCLSRLASSGRRRTTKARPELSGSPRAGNRVAPRVSTAWTEADVPEANADVLHAIYDQICRHRKEDRVGESHAVGLCPGLGAYAAEKGLARPTGVGRAITTYGIPIEGRDEWLAAARRMA